MTNKEAIDILRNAAWLGTDAEREQIEEAVEMAVNALTAQPETHEKRTETHGVCLDAIDRQAVFDALDNIKIPRNASWYPYYQQALTAVSKLPSAQPDSKELSFTQKKLDTISRQAAIDYCYALINAENPSDPSDEWNYSQERINQTEVILHHLEVMPSAQPEVLACGEGELSAQSEIIRCKDCKLHGTNGYRLNCAMFCCTMPDDGFCSCGERREDG